LANGLAGPSVLPRVPDLQEELRFSDAGLGVALGGLALGALVASPVAGRLVARRGAPAVGLPAIVALGLVLGGVDLAVDGPTLLVALAVVGAMDAAADIAMNAAGAGLQAARGRSVMHRLHAAWSVGALGAAGIGGGAAAAGVPVGLHLAGVGLVVAGTGVAVRGGLRALAATAVAPGPTSDEPGAAAGPVPVTGRRGLVAGSLGALAAATVAAALVEGAPADWGALQLERAGAGRGASAAGFGAFAAGMVVGRLAGDALTDRIGATAVLRRGSGLAGAGLALGLLVDHPVALVVGFAVVGAGASGTFPLLFAAAGRVPGVGAGRAAATVSLTARVGFLIGPVAIGAAAELVGLRRALAGVAVAATLLAVAAPRVIVPPRPARDPHAASHTPGTRD